MFADKYALAGWLAIASAIVVVPEIVAALILERLSHAYPGAKILVAALHVIGLLISVYVLYMFRSLLNERCNFHKADGLIAVLIGASLLFTLIGLMGIIPDWEDVISVVVLVLFVPFSVITAVFGYKLLKLGDDLFGLARPFAYTTMASGILGATVILMPIGLLAQLAALVIMGMIFLRAKEQAEFV